jgi:hypothetical protein
MYVREENFFKNPQIHESVCMCMICMFDGLHTCHPMHTYINSHVQDEMNTYIHTCIYTHKCVYVYDLHVWLPTYKSSYAYTHKFTCTR